MSAATSILLERDNINDEYVTLVRWFAKHGDKVEKDALLAEVETSKANLEVHSPAAGFLRWNFREGMAVPVMASIGSISDQPVGENEQPGGAAFEQDRNTGQLTDNLTVMPGIPAQAWRSPHSHAGIGMHGQGGTQSFPAVAAQKQRFTPLAWRMMHENGLNSDAFSGRALIRKQDVEAVISSASNRTVKRALSHVATPQQDLSIKQAFVEVPLTKMKLSEGRNLAAGMGNAVASSISVTCDIRGVRQLAVRIVHEVSRLLRKYPMFNATYRDDSMLQYKDVNLGFAMNDGRGLKVAVLQQCDTLSVDEVGERIRELTMAYLYDKLTPAQISNATFTITDLSGLGLSSFFPLISENQGAVLGVCAELGPQDSDFGHYTFTLTFDHQLSDGRTAALFLNELKKCLLEKTAIV
jgi:2-oxoglutarate dehydrogenase E2 component (dihydrolipoamide succinyltransferase)